MCNNLWWIHLQVCAYFYSFTLFSILPLCSSSVFYQSTVIRGSWGLHSSKVSNKIETSHLLYAGFLASDASV
jgi:hypothetical protein